MINTDFPTECLVCRDAAGHIVTDQCPNRCDGGLIYPDGPDEILYPEWTETTPR